MREAEEWYEVAQLKDYLYIIRERLDEIEPRFLTKFINIYLLIGSKKALLIDTGTGLYPLKPKIKDLIGTKELIVINTHSHFDHRGGNEEFDEIYIHESELGNASMIFDISFLKDSPKKRVQLFEQRNFKYHPPHTLHPLKDGDEFDLGDLTVKVIHTPGHSIGSISLLTNQKELFTGDSAHFGAMYLPKKRNFPTMLSSLSKLLDLFLENDDIEIYPSHEDFQVKKALLESLIKGINEIETIWDAKIKDKYLNAWILKDNDFTYII
ncbi:MAG: MBL fold metallo-hydrolase [Candidatus Lokiarchaeota archaeon]|nr:MBL fold metallo-hydrolase [Candidatus Lokiarchaeota archaeon]